NGFDLDWGQLRREMGRHDFDVLIYRFTPTTFDPDAGVATLAKELQPKATTAGTCWTLRENSEEVLRDAPDLDVFIRHEYEEVAPALVRALDRGEHLSSVPGIAFRANGTVVETVPAEPVKNLDRLPLPAYDLLPSLEPYHINTVHGKPFTIMYTSKGCPYGCTFCTVANTRWKVRSAESILEELRYLKREFDVNVVSFFDETFTMKRDRSVAIAKSIAADGLDIRWYCNTRVNLVDPDLLQILYYGGCRGISLGVESGSQELLDGVEKGANVDQAAQAIRWVKDAGIKVYCSFILGLPGETKATLKETLDFVKRTLPTGAQFNVAVPYPGTKMFEFALEKGWIESTDWRDYFQHAAIMSTDGLTPEDLNAARNAAYRALYFNPRWYLQNCIHVLRHPEDLRLAVRYVLKITDNYLVHHMTHAH
ncbi:MAG: B12-binding domain-containing radical SAM protein, partial [Thermoplasmata archaeon]